MNSAVAGRTYLSSPAGTWSAMPACCAPRSCLFRANRRTSASVGSTSTPTFYNGLDETLDERIHYRIRTPRDGGPRGPVILAGPTCDSADILYRRHPYELPLDLAIGDPVDFLSAGAYTASVAAVAFNGFSPIRSYFV